MQGKVVVTGAAGYIGSHVCLELLLAGWGVVAIDDLSNGHAEALLRVQDLAGKSLDFIKGDVREPILYESLANLRVDAAIHLAGKKAVSESIRIPLDYYDVNLVGTMRLVTGLQRAGVRTLVFSSSATVYDQQERSPIKEAASVKPINPYGRTKLFAEQLLKDVCEAGARWRVLSLRYFNPVGAHKSGRIGEDPRGIPSNLFPIIADTATRRREFVPIYGTDYPTKDGTGVRDYIHVVDLARAHVAALEYLVSTVPNSVREVNLGTGHGHSVLDALVGWQEAVGRKLPYVDSGRRAGDVAVSFADPTLAKHLLGWSAAEDFASMCADHWRWRCNFPDGYH